MINSDQVEYIANLGRLKLSDKEVDIFTRQLGSILEYAEQLNKVDTSNIEPTCYVIPEHDPLRDDVAKPSLSTADAVKNAPKVKNGYFAIPKVIG